MLKFDLNKLYQIDENQVAKFILLDDGFIGFLVYSFRNGNGNNRFGFAFKPLIVEDNIFSFTKDIDEKYDLQRLTEVVPVLLRFKNPDLNSNAYMLSGIYGKHELYYNDYYCHLYETSFDGGKTWIHEEKPDWDKYFHKRGEIGKFFRNDNKFDISIGSFVDHDNNELFRIMGTDWNFHLIEYNLSPNYAGLSNAFGHFIKIKPSNLADIYGNAKERKEKANQAWEFYFGNKVKTVKIDAINNMVKEIITNGKNVNKLFEHLKIYGE